MLRHLMNVLDLSMNELDELLKLAGEIYEHPDDYKDVCSRKKLATCFYEPSTRTRLSFESAMLNLGGQVLGFSSADSSSAAKGESVADTIRVISSYADICAMRHPKEGAPYVASLHSLIPVINAGDGGHQHPTQTLTDLMTIAKLKGGFSGLTIGLCGDLKFGRTVHSLVEAMVRYPDVHFIMISPDELKIPDYLRKDILDRNLIDYKEVNVLEDVMPDLDILYMTRVQQERFSDPMEYEKVKDVYRLDASMLGGVRSNMKILHPLPRINEIAQDVDDTPYAYYFKQAENGMYVRMAIIACLLGYR